MADLVDYLGYQVTPEQAAFLDQVIEGGLMPGAALKSLGYGMKRLADWKRDESLPDFAIVYAEVAKELLALHRVESGSEILERAKGEIMALTGEDVKKASALANLARSRSDAQFRLGERLDAKSWGHKNQLDMGTGVQAIVFLPTLAPMPVSQHEPLTALPTHTPPMLPALVEEHEHDGVPASPPQLHP